MKGAICHSQEYLNLNVLVNEILLEDYSSRYPGVIQTWVAV